MDEDLETALEKGYVSDSSSDLPATPTLAEVTAVTTPTSDTTPDYIFSSTEAGTITYGGSCSSGTTSATNGNNTITFNTLSDGTYSNCSITVTDTAGNASSALSVSTFVVDTTATAIAGGKGHTCALLSGGTVQCWGYGYKGQLGNGSITTTQGIPVSVSSISTATAVVAGTDHTCALLSGGTVQCWGKGNYGQLGNGSTSNQSTPVSVSSISSATAISAGGWHTCALLSGGTVQCWGYNYYGQLGNGSTSNQSTPVSVSSISTATAISAGGWYHACAVLSGGTVQCWGHGGYGRLGNGLSNQSTPVYVVGFGG
jgi:alpha-tubulin suppressor-like RCC1 family protein